MVDLYPQDVEEKLEKKEWLWGLEVFDALDVVETQGEEKRAGDGLQVFVVDLEENEKDLLYLVGSIGDNFHS